MCYERQSLYCEWVFNKDVYLFAKNQRRLGLSSREQKNCAVNESCLLNKSKFCQ